MQRGRKEQKLNHWWMPCAEGQWARSLGEGGGKPAGQASQRKELCRRAEGQVGEQSRKSICGRGNSIRLGDGRTRQVGKTFNHCIPGASASNGLDSERKERDSAGRSLTWRCFCALQKGLEANI